MICFGEDDDFEFGSPRARVAQGPGHVRTCAGDCDLEGREDDPQRAARRDGFRPMPAHLWRSPSWRAWARFQIQRSEFPQAS